MFYFIFSFEIIAILWGRLYMCMNFDTWSKNPWDWKFQNTRNNNARENINISFCLHVDMRKENSLAISWVETFYIGNCWLLNRCMNLITHPLVSWLGAMTERWKTMQSKCDTQLKTRIFFWFHLIGGKNKRESILFDRSISYKYRFVHIDFLCSMN